MYDLLKDALWYHVYCDDSKLEKNKVPCVDLEKLADALPHGSGFNGNWNITIRKNGDIHCSSVYQTMNEYGYYGKRVNCSFSLRRATENGLIVHFP